MINCLIELTPKDSSKEPVTYNLHYPNFNTALACFRMHVRIKKWVKYGKLYRILENGQQTLSAVYYH